MRSTTAFANLKSDSWSFPWWTVLLPYKAIYMASASHSKYTLKPFPTCRNSWTLLVLSFWSCFTIFMLLLLAGKRRPPFIASSKRCTISCCRSIPNESQSCLNKLLQKTLPCRPSKSISLFHGSVTGGNGGVSNLTIASLLSMCQLFICLTLSSPVWTSLITKSKTSLQRLSP